MNSVGLNGLCVEEARLIAAVSGIQRINQPLAEKEWSAVRDSAKRGLTPLIFA